MSPKISRAKLAPAGQVRCFAGKGLWSELDGLRRGPAKESVVPVSPGLCAEIKYFGRHRGGSIRDGLILSLSVVVALAASGEPRSWSCDSDEVVAAFESYDTNLAN
jgi:hypothetical protein